MSLFILLSLASLGAAFMAFMPEDSSDDGRGDDGPDDDTPENPDDDTPEDPDDKAPEDPDGDAAADVRGTDQADDLVASGNLIARGFGGDDTLAGSNQSVLFGDQGNDELTLADEAVGFGGMGADTLDVTNRSAGYGGEGNDTLTLDQIATGFGGDGDDRIFLTGRPTGYGGSGNDTLSLMEDGFADLYGDEGNDVLTYASTQNGTATTSFYGGEGDDTLHSSYYGTNAEAMYFPDNARFSGGAGNDLIQISAGGTAFGGAGNDTIIGFADTKLTGDAGSDLFVARSFAFGMEGGTYIYDDTSPRSGAIVELSGETITVTDFAKGEDRLQIDFGGMTPTSVDLADDGTDTTVTAVFDDANGDPFTSIVLIQRVTGLTFDDITFSNGAGATPTFINGQRVYSFTSGTPLTL